MQPARLNSSVFELLTQCYVLAACMSERQRLYECRAPVADLDTVTISSIVRVLELQAEVERLAGLEGGDALRQTVGSLTMSLRDKIGEANATQLRDISREYGLSGLDPSSLHEACSAVLNAGAPSPGILDSLGRFVFILALSTVATAAVGAPVAAVLSHQAVGMKMLDEAVTTFCSVAIVEGVVRYDDFRRSTASAAPEIRTLPRDAARESLSRTAKVDEILEAARRRVQDQKFERIVPKHKLDEEPTPTRRPPATNPPRQRPGDPPGRSFPAPGR
jgi:hypothetical protein